MTRQRSLRTVALLAAGVLGSLLLGGCGGQGNAEAGNARAAAASFSQDVERATDRACALLAPRTLEELEASEGPCTTALVEALRPAESTAAPGRVESAEVYGKDAIVRLSSDTVFLARFSDGWRVTAAGCSRAETGRPYDCKIKGD